MPKKTTAASKVKVSSGKDFHVEWLNTAQKLAWNAFQQHDVLFLIGPAGTGKTFLAMSFAIKQLLAKEVSKIVLTRPIVEAGESLGYLPGTFEEKVNPYMMPLYDAMDKLVGREGPYREKILHSTEIAPLAYLRGRAQPLDATIYTPTGPRKMGDLKIGDSVIGSNGQPCRLTGVYPQGKKKVYKIAFSDGSSTECCGEHLWSTQTLSEKRHNKGFSVKQTQDIAKNIKTKFNQKNHRIPVMGYAANFEKKEVSIDPYLLGLLLGDGSLHEDASVTVSTKDVEIVEAISKVLPDDMQIVYASRYDYRLVRNDGKINPLKNYLRELNLLGTKSHNKYVPDIYKYNSVDTRLAILQGLMDSDGSIYNDRNSKRIEYSSTSQQLAKDVVYLVQSLGGIAYINKREYDETDTHEYKGRDIIHAHPSYRVSIVMPNMAVNPFRLARKRDQFIPRNPVRLISSITEIGKKECQCISVDAKDHLYVTDGFIVTHNTFENAVCIFDEAQNASFLQLKLFLTRFGEGAKVIVTGDPKQSDLRGPVALTKVVDKLKEVPGVGMVEFKANSIVRHALVGKILEKLEEPDPVPEDAPSFDAGLDDPVPSYGKRLK